MYTKEQKQIDMEIARACGWTNVGIDGYSLGHFPYGNIPKIEGKAWTSTPQMIPRYSGDLNAMHEAEKVLSATQLKKYHDVLVAGVIGWGAYGNEHIAIHASAAQRAEAFLRTLNLWKA